MPDSTFFSERMEGLTLFSSIIEMVLVVTPARSARSRWERPFILRMDCSRTPTSNDRFLLRNGTGKKCAVSWQQCSVFTTAVACTHRREVRTTLARLRSDDLDLHPHLRGIQAGLHRGARRRGTRSDPGVPFGVHAGVVSVDIAQIQGGGQDAGLVAAGLGQQAVNGGEGLAGLLADVAGQVIG